MATSGQMDCTGGSISGNAVGYASSDQPGVGTIAGWLDQSVGSWIGLQGYWGGPDVVATMEAFDAQPALAWCECFVTVMDQWYAQGGPAEAANVGMDAYLNIGGTRYGQWHYTPKGIRSWEWTYSPRFAVPASLLTSPPKVEIWCGYGSYKYADSKFLTGYAEWQRVNAVTWSVTRTVLAPVAGGVGPSGVVNTNNPTITWTATWYGAADSFQVQVLTGGAVTYDSGQRPYTGNSFTIPVALSQGAHTVQVRLWQRWSTSGGTQTVTQPGDWGTSSFTVSPAAPPVPPPTIPANVVATLAAADRVLLTRPHRPSFQAVLFQWDGSASWPLAVIGGSVTYDGTNRVRSTANVLVADSELVPPSAEPLDFARPLHPFGQYVHLARGVGGSLVSLGTFRVERVEVEATEVGRPPARVELRDWAAFLADARGTYPRTRQDWTATPQPQFVHDVIKTIIAEGACASRVPATTATRVETNYTNDRGFDRTEALDGLASSVGWVWYADHDGAIFAGTAPDPATDTVRYAFTEGADAVILSKGITLDRAEVYDLVVATNDDQSVYATAYDSAMASPIQRAGGDILQPWLGRGPFSPGSKPFFYASPVIVNSAGAKSAASTVLKRRALPADRIRFNAVPVPDLRPGHVVTVLRVGATVAERFMIVQLELPLDVSSEMTVTAAAQAPYVNPVTT